MLVDKYGKIKLCDFGFGKRFDPTKLLDTYCGSPFYAAPEMVTATPYRGPPVDMWSCGVILYAMLTGQLPFHCDTMPELFKKISLGHYIEPTTLSEEALSLIKALLCRNPKRRMTAENALKHPWLMEKMPTQSPQLKKIIRMSSVMSTTFKNHPKHYNRSRPTIHISSSSPSSTLPSPVISVGDEELASYNTPSSSADSHQKASKATRFLLNALNKKSQVAPSREKQKDTSKKGSKALLVTAVKIKKFFTNTFIHRRLATT